MMQIQQEQNIWDSYFLDWLEYTVNTSTTTLQHSENHLLYTTPASW